MNEAMKVENIQEYFQKLGKTVEQNFVYGYVEPKVMTYAVWGAFSSFKIKNYIVGFFPEEVIFIGINLKGNFAEEHFSLPVEEMDSIEVKNRLIQHKVIIKAGGEKLPLKCNKKILGAPWQKENIDYLESVNWYQPAMG